MRLDPIITVWHEDVDLVATRCSALRRLSTPNCSPFRRAEFLTRLFTFHLGQRVAYVPHWCDRIRYRRRSRVTFDLACRFHNDRIVLFATGRYTRLKIEKKKMERERERNKEKKREPRATADKFLSETGYVIFYKLLYMCH